MTPRSLRPGNLQGRQGTKDDSLDAGAALGSGSVRTSEKANVKFAQSRWQKVPRHAEVFPLPAYEAEAAARVGLSRGCRSRVGRRRHFQEDVAECLWALDWNSGLAGQPPCGPPSSVQQEVVARVEAAVGSVTSAAHVSLLHDRY